MSEIVFPGNPVDGTTFFHEDNVCVYHAEDNTWECRAVVSETPQPPLQSVYMTTSRVYTLGNKRAEWQSVLTDGGVNYTVPPVQSQEDVNDAIMDLLVHVQSGVNFSITGASTEWVTQNYAPLSHTHANYATQEWVTTQLSNTTLPDDIPTRAEFNALMTAVMTAIASHG